MAMENYLWAIPSEMCISNLNPIVFREEINSLVPHPCCTFFHQNLSIMQHQNFIIELSISLLCLLFLPHIFKLHTQELLKNRFEVIWGSLCMAKTPVSLVVFRVSAWLCHSGHPFWYFSGPLETTGMGFMACISDSFLFISWKAGQYSIWHCPAWYPCLSIWIWWMDYQVDKELAGWSDSKSCGQWLDV